MANVRLSYAPPLDDPLATLCKDAEQACPSDNPEGSSCSSSSAIALVIVGGNCGVAMYRSWGDPWSVAFVAASFVILVALFSALRVLERTPHGSPRRAYVKSGVWALTTVLTVMFSYRVASLLPFPVAIVVWAMSISTVIVGFYMLFVCREEDESEAEEKPYKLADVV